MERQLADLFAECLDWMSEKGGTAEQAAARYPEQCEALLQLLETAKQIETVPEVLPRPEFSAVARLRLQNQLKTKRKPVTFFASNRHIRQTNTGNRRFAMTWLIVLGMIATLLAGGGGVAYASTDALPGDALYSVKTAIQDVELALTDDVGDVDLLLGFMNANVGEVQELAAQARWDDLVAGLGEYQQNLEALTQTQTRVSYDQAPGAEQLDNRVQEQLHTQSQLLQQIQERVQDQQQVMDKLQETIRQAEMGAAYGPGEGGPSEEPGQPNGAGPGEPQGGQNSDDQSGKPEDAGNPDAGGQGGQPTEQPGNQDNGNGAGGPSDENDNGNGSGNGNDGAGEGTGPGSGVCQQVEDCTCEEGDPDCICDTVCVCAGGEENCTCEEKCTLDQEGDGEGGPSDGGDNGNGQGGKP